MNFLCICQCGHSRSVAMTRILHARGFPAVAVGASTCGEAYLHLLGWATHIIVMQAHFANIIDQNNGVVRGKLVTFDVGPDKWANPYNHELLALCETKFIHHFGDIRQ